MHLSSTNIFLDTEVFVRANYNCRSKKFDTIVQHARAGDIKLFITDIVEGETRAAIRTDVNHAFESLGKIRDDIRVLNNAETFRKATSRDQKEKYSGNVETIFNSFLRRTRAKRVSTANVPTGPIMTLYFESKPPFDKANKKHEFPDAINIAFVAQWTIAKNTDAIFVSKDKDIPLLVDLLDANDRIFCYETIEELISNIVASKEFEKELEAAILSAHATFEKDLADMVADAAISIRSFDAEAEERTLLSYNVTSVNVLNAEDNYALCECEFEIEYELTVSYKDPGSFWWDNEDKEAYYPIRKHATKSRIDYFMLEVELTRDEPVPNGKWTSYRQRCPRQ